jgi:hypothetical protein
MEKMDNDGENGENGEARPNGHPSISEVINKLGAAYSKLKEQTVKAAAAVNTKTEVCNEIREAVNLFRQLRNTLSDEATTTLIAMRAEMKELQTSMKEVKETTKAAKTTYAHAAANPAMMTTLNTRHERARHDVTLQATDDKTKDSLAKVSCRRLTGIIQKAIDDTIHQDKPVLLGVQKRTKDGAIRIRCNTEEEANMLREMDWEVSVEGLEAHKPKYGIVVYKVDKKPYDKLTHDEDETWIKHVKNVNNIPIVNIAPLLRKNENDSIIIFTTDPHAADRCIKQGIYIDCCLYNAQKYAPEQQITQCYNCGGYGHRAAQCQNKQRCGKCGKDNHGTRECKHTGKPKCSNCHGDHENWHHNCSARTTERRRLKGLHARRPRFFTL